MSADVLKTRARNLQQALSEAFKQPVKLSQAYELIAREEGFPNWDTASAKLTGSEVAASPTTKRVQISTSPGTRTSSSKIHDAPPPWLENLLFDSNSKKPGLTVVSGKPGCGKSPIASLLLFAWAQTNRRCIYSSEQLDEDQFKQMIRSALRTAPDVLYIGEISSVARAEMVVELLDTGHRVIATMDAPSAMPLHEALAWRIPELKNTALLERFGASEGFTKHQLFITSDRR